MSVIVLLIVAGGAVAAGFLGAFVWAVRSGQFDDTTTPAVRMLFEHVRPRGASVRGPQPERPTLRRRRFGAIAEALAKAGMDAGPRSQAIDDDC